jgi:hypothetical protein
MYALQIRIKNYEGIFDDITKWRSQGYHSEVIIYGLIK